MQTGQPSRTALGAAQHRADHQELDGAAIFTDPLARAIAGAGEHSSGVGATPEQQALYDSMRQRMRGFIACRARFAEDALADAVAAGVTQAVILGAGLDTFAYRNPYPELRVFEVDHPDTQAWKRERLAHADIAVPGSVTYVPIDFERQSLEQALPAAGFDPARPAFVIWLGVTVYLTREAIDQTLGYLGTLAPDTQVVFDYGTGRREVQDPELRAIVAERERRLAAIGEQWISHFTPEEITELLRAHGFRVEEELPATDLAMRYLNRPATASGGPRIVRARVTAES